MTLCYPTQIFMPITLARYVAEASMVVHQTKLPHYLLWGIAL